MSRPAALPPKEAAERVASRLLEAGYETYFAGGCVRDHLLGLEPTDFDVATAARPEQVTGLFRHARGVGAHFGVMLVPSGGRSVEVATFRSDGAYRDGRRPTEVVFGSAEADARRRDFTINGLFQEPGTGRIIDHVGGRADLEAGILRAIGEAEDRFEEDRLRMLRAVRFAARFRLDVDPATRTAIESRAERLGAVSRERVGQELRRMLGHPTRATAAALAETFGLDRSILGALRRADVVGLARLAGLAPTVAWEDALAAWELDRGLLGDDEGAVEAAGSRLGEALVLSNREHDDLVGVLQARRWIRGSWETAGVAARKRRAAAPAFARGLALLATEPAGTTATVETVRAEVARLSASGLSPVPLIGGDDLVAAGLRPGPAFRRILDSVYDRQLEGAISTREEALAEALRLDRGSTPAENAPDGQERPD